MNELRKDLDLDALGKARLLQLMVRTHETLDELDAFTLRWAKRNIERLYYAVRNDVRRELRRMNYSRKAAEVARYAVIDRAAVESLVMDPQTGFVGSLRNATEEVRDRLKTIRNQARLLRAHQGAFDETIARIGILEGKAANTVRDALVREIVQLKDSADMVFRKSAAKLGAGDIISNVANLPYMKYQTATGERHVRVDHYAQMLARTKTKQAVGLARRHTLIQHGLELVRVSLNRPLQDDACWLYLGKAFALTKRAADEYGVVHVKRLPSGGVPFHPNCTHSERAFIIENRTEEEIELAFQPPPAWALDKPWSMVQKEYKRRGGKAIAREANPAAARFSRQTGGRKRRQEQEARR